MSQRINFTDPIGRIDYLKGVLVRLLVSIIVMLFISDFNEERIYEIADGYQFQFLATIIFLDLDFRRVKDIGINMNWLYSYIFLCLLPYPYTYSFLGEILNLLTIIFAFYLFLKKGAFRSESEKKNFNMPKRK
tara:strand:+ start:104 stop:502 length:399 start_codon:yes stop_codon:yes gene_type:complete